MALLRHDDPRERRAHLAGQEAREPRDRPGRLADVEVVEDHRGRLAAELERATRDPLAADRADLAPRGGRAGEGHLVDVRMTHEQLRDLAVRREHVEHAGGQADRLAHLGEHITRAGRFGRGLEDHRAAREQRGPAFVGDQ